MSNSDSDDPDPLPGPVPQPDPDLTLATALLIGFVERGRQGSLRNKYFEKRSTEDRHAREAIVRLLRSEFPLDRLLRMHLADLFDPSADWVPRTIEFKSRRQGPHTDHIRNTQIAEHVWKEVTGGKRVTAAIDSAAGQFALSADMVTKIWSTYRPILEGIYGPLSGEAPHS
jgi:hypothetical protein